MKANFSLCFYSVLVDSRLLVVSSTTWPCTPVLPPSIAESVAKPSLLATSFCCIKNPGIPTNVLTLASGVAKDFCLPINWPSIAEECTPARNPSNVTCATRGSPTQGMCFYCPISLLKFVRLTTLDE